MPLTQRINIRAIVFTGVVVFLLGWPTFIFVREAFTKGVIDHGSYVEVNLKASGNFLLVDNDTIDAVPPQYRALDGRHVVFTGQIWAPYESGAVGHFELVYSITQCCFSGPPRVQERVFCTVPDGRRLERPDAATNAFCTVEGILHVKIVKDETGHITSVYAMDVDKITGS